jgi:hypothetical protein
MSWTASGAHGSGFNWLNNCIPSCAGATFYQFPVTLTLSRSREVQGRRLFTRMTVTYAGTPPHGERHRSQV